MNKKYACYCGLNCKNCAVKVKVEPTAANLLNEMNKLGFESIISFFPKGEDFWSFLNTMSRKGLCLSCKEGSGNPTCKVRQCARERNIEMCAFCDEYPCNYFSDFFKGYSTLESDNKLLRNQGWQEWEKLQKKRNNNGIAMAYKIDKNKE